MGALLPIPAFASVRTPSVRCFRGRARPDQGGKSLMGEPKRICLKKEFSRFIPASQPSLLIGVPPATKLGAVGIGGGAEERDRPPAPRAMMPLIDDRRAACRQRIVNGLRAEGLEQAFADESLLKDVVAEASLGDPGRRVTTDLLQVAEQARKIQSKPVPSASAFRSAQPAERLWPSLLRAAGSLSLCSDPKLRNRGHDG
jgi:hypothetical protein